MHVSGKISEQHPNLPLWRNAKRLVDRLCFLAQIEITRYNKKQRYLVFCDRCVHYVRDQDYDNEQNNKRPKHEESLRIVVKLNDEMDSRYNKPRTLQKNINAHLHISMAPFFSHHWVTWQNHKYCSADLPYALLIVIM